MKHQFIPNILRISQASQYLGISRATLNRWKRAGHLPPLVKLGPNSVGFKREDLDQWIMQRMEATNK